MDEQVFEKNFEQALAGRTKESTFAVPLAKTFADPTRELNDRTDWNGAGPRTITFFDLLSKSENSRCPCDQ